VLLHSPVTLFLLVSNALLFALCPDTKSVFPLLWEPHFQIHKNNRKNYNFVYFNLSRK
jgi:hypothetical protein